MVNCSVCGKKIKDEDVYVLPFSSYLVCLECLEFIEQEKEKEK